MTIGNAFANLAKTYFPFGAQTTVDINSQKVFEDVCFSTSRRFTIPASGQTDIVYDGTGISDGKTLVVLPISFITNGGGPVFVDLYFAPDSDEDGTLWPFSNRNGTSSVVSESTLRLNPTVNDVGIENSQYLIPGISQGNLRVGGQASENLILIGRTDGKYLFRLVNQDAVVLDASMAITIFEAEPI